MWIIAISAALLLGFLAGLLTFKRKLMWCDTCGNTLTCVPCSDQRPYAVRTRPMNALRG